MPQDQDRPITLEEFEEQRRQYYGIPTGLTASLRTQESGGRQYDQSGRVLTSPRQARGRYQVLKSTAAKYGLNPDDPFENIEASFRYLSELHKQVDPNVADPGERWAQTLAGYHAGEGRLRQVNKTGVLPSTSDGQIRTDEYVASIMKRWQQHDSGELTPQPQPQRQALDPLRAQQLNEMVTNFGALKRQGSKQTAAELAKEIKREFGDLMETGADRSGWPYVKPKAGSPIAYDPSKLVPSKPFTPEEAEAQARQVKQRAAAPAPGSFAGVVNQFLQSAIKGTAAIPEGFAELVGALPASPETMGAVIEQMAVEGKTPEQMEAEFPARLKAATDPAREQAAIRRDFRPITERGAAFAERATPIDPTDQGFWTAKVPSALGSTVPFALGTLATGGNPLAGAVLGASANAQQIAREFDEAGVDPARRDRAILFAGATGLTEVFGVTRALSRFGLNRAFVRRAVDILEEGGQEALQAYLNNVNAALVGAYDPNRPASQGVLESAVLGGIVGGGVQGLSAGAARLRQDRARSPLAPPTTPTAAQPTPADRPILESAAAQTRARADQPQRPEVDASLQAVRTYTNRLAEIEQAVPEGPEREAAVEQARQEYLAARRAGLSEEAQANLAQPSPGIQLSRAGLNTVRTGRTPGQGAIITPPSSLEPRGLLPPATGEEVIPTEPLSRAVVERIGQPDPRFTPRPPSERPTLELPAGEQRRQTAGLPRPAQPEAAERPPSAPPVPEVNQRLIERTKAKAEELIEQGQYEEAISELEAHQQALTDAKAGVPRKMSGERVRLAREIDRTKTRIRQVRKTAQDAAKQGRAQQQAQKQAPTLPLQRAIDENAPTGVLAPPVQPTTRPPSAPGAAQEPTMRITEGEGAELPRQPSRRLEGQPVEIPTRRPLAFPERQQQQIASRRAAQAAAPKGIFGKFGEYARKPGVDRNRPALAEHPELRRLLKLPEMPSYLDDAGKFNPAWNEAAQDTLNALAELGQVGRSSELDVEKLRGVYRRLQLEARRQGAPAEDPKQPRFGKLSDDLKNAFRETVEKTMEAQAGFERFVTDGRIDNILRTLEDAASEQRQLGAREQSQLKTSTVTSAKDAGLTRHFAEQWFKQAVDSTRRRAEQRRVEPSARDRKAGDQGASEGTVPVAERATGTFGKQAPKTEETPTVSHPNPEIDRKPILAETNRGTVLVPNPENKTGVSEVKDHSDEPTDYKFSSTQVNLPKDVADEIIAYGKRIPDADLADDGREDTPHITVKFGLHGSDPKFTREALAGEGPVEIKFGKVSLFTTNDDFDVVKVDIESPDLHRLNKAIAESQPVTDTHPGYKPHATIAYVKKGKGAQYVGDTFLEGRTVTLDSVMFSGRDGEKVDIPLAGKTGEEVAAPPADTVSPETLTNMGLLREFGGRWQYKTDIKGPWLTANREEDAVDRATGTYQKLPESERITSTERADRDYAKKIADWMKRYEGRSSEELERKLQANRAEQERLNERKSRLSIHQMGTQRSASIKAQLDGLAEENDEMRAVLDARKAKGAPAETPTTVAGHLDAIKALHRGEMSAADARRNVEWLLENQSAIKAELGKLTIADLKKQVFSYHAKTKREWVNAAFGALLQDYTLDIPIAYQMFRETPEHGVRRALDQLTDEKIKAYAESRRAKIESVKKAVTNPETLEEFEEFIRLRKGGESALTPEQRAKYDELIAQKNKTERRAEKEEKATVKQVDVGDVGMEIKKHYHTKMGQDVYIVTLSDRVDRAKYEELNAAAKRMGGWYSRAFHGSPAGFAFKTEEDAQRFLSLREGDVSQAERVQKREEVKQERRVSALRTVAESLEEKANAALNVERKVNTHKRAQEAASAEARANADLAMAKTMNNLAEAIESGEAKHLDGVRAKTHVETLNSVLQAAKAERSKQTGESYAKSQERQADEDDIQAVKYPYPAIHKENIKNYIEALKGVPGAKLLADRLREKMMAAMANESQWRVEFRTEREIADYDALIEKAGRKLRRWDLESLKSDGEKYKRLQAMGVMDEPSLRAALREYLQFRKGVAKADPLKQAERELIGTRIPGFFPTPKSIVDRLLEEADLREGMAVLEPSAGKGNIADAIRAESGITPTTIEVNSTLRKLLEMKGYTLADSDFLEHKGEYDRIVMNPPFEDGQDIEHVRHAYSLLRPGGRVVAVMSEGSFGRGDKQATAFREWLESVGGRSEKLPEGAFKESDRSTGVNTRMVVISKPAQAKPATVATVSPELQKEKEREARQPAIEQAEDIGGGVLEPASAGRPKVRGQSTSVEIPGTEKEYAARYEIRELADIQPSHDPHSFQKNPKYQLVNDRDYTSTANRIEVENATKAGAFKPRRVLTDDPTVANGPPVIMESGDVLGGNSRTMMLKRVYANHPADAQKYRDDLKERARNFGVDAAEFDNFKEPILVRVIEGTHDNWQKIVTELNVQPGKALSATESAIAKAKQLPPETMQFLSDRLADEGPEGTLAQALEGAKGVRILNRLIEDGIIPPHERNRYLTDQNTLTPGAKQEVEQMLLGRMFRDADQMKRTPPEMRNKLIRVAPQLAKTAGAEWDIADLIPNAIEAAQASKAEKIDLGELNKRGFLFGEGVQYSPEELAVAALLKNFGPRQVENAFKDYAKAYEESQRGAGLFGEPMSQAEAFNDIFQPEGAEQQGGALFSVRRDRGAAEPERSEYWDTPLIPRGRYGQTVTLTPEQTAEHFEHSRSEFREHATRARLYTNEQGAFTYAAAIGRAMQKDIPIAIDGIAVPLKDARATVKYLLDRAAQADTPARRTIYDNLAGQLERAIKFADRKREKAVTIVSTDARAMTGVGLSRKSFRAIRQVAAHEETHVWEMETGGKQGAGLFDDDVITSDSDYDRQRRVLIFMGYSPNMSPADVSAEAVAHIAAGQWKDLGYKSETEALNYLERVFERVYADFGVDALRSLRLRAPGAKGVKERVIERFRPGLPGRVQTSGGAGTAPRPDAGREGGGDRQSLRGREGEGRRPAEGARREVSRTEPTFAAARQRRIGRQELADAAIAGASKIAKGPVSYAEWSRDMVREFGELPSPQLLNLWQKAKALQTTTPIEALVKDTENLSSWRDWYDRHEPTIEDLFDDDAPLFRQILAATSQRQGVKGNVTMALRAYRQMKAGEPLEGYLVGVVRNLERIRRGERITGPKIGEFDKGMTDRDVNAMAVDRHVAEVLFGTKTPTLKQIERAKFIIRTIADKLGWTSIEAQSVLWAYNQIRAGKEPADYEQELKRRADEIRSLRAEVGGREGRGVSPGARLREGVEGSGRERARGIGAGRPGEPLASVQPRPQEPPKATRRDVKMRDYLRSPLSNLNYVGTYENLAGPVGREVSDLFRQTQIDIANQRYSRETGIEQLRQALKPLLAQIREQGQPGLSRWIEAHVDALVDPDEAFRGLAGFLKGFQYNFKLRLNPRSTFVNWLQPMQTLWPHLTTTEFWRIFREARNPATRERLAELASRESGGKVEEVDRGDRKFLDPFGKVSISNRIMGHLAGELIADKLELKGDDKRQMAADWASKVEYDNSRYNVPPLFRGTLASVLGQFKPFTIKNLERLYSDWKEAPEGTSSGTLARRSKMVFSQVAVGGVRSVLLPGVKEITGVLILGALAKALGGFMDDDDADYWAEAIYFGAPALIDQDLSSSVMLVDSPYGDTPAEKMVNFFGGPTASLLMKGWTEGKYMSEAKEGRTSKEEKLEASALRLAKAVTPYTKTVQSVVNYARGKPTTIRLGGKDEPLNLKERIGYAAMGTPKRQSVFYEKAEAFDWQKQMLGEPTIKRLPGDTDRTHRQRGERVEKWTKQFEAELLRHPRYKVMKKSQRQDALETLRRRIGTEANNRRPDLSKLRAADIIRATREAAEQKPERDRRKIIVNPD